MNRRPSASDWCEFPHSLDYSFTLDLMSLGGGRYVVDIISPTAFVSLWRATTSLCTFSTRDVELGSRLPYP
ncbi:hypothetical protein [cyanobacterium endosymbiont of Rhopalodia gibberula]|uniref:hypothetical protein n=1 Tax=cyanobacterium endosymbiont of Rhopalodia gibberula TaxID=1763363 RepID=UPI0011AB3851|nr:hypothetical protein [cyanobacterium endosymbiont of Rhopalodia gibberula]